MMTDCVSACTCVSMLHVCPCMHVYMTHEKTTVSIYITGERTVSMYFTGERARVRVRARAREREKEHQNMLSIGNCIRQLTVFYTFTISYTSLEHAHYTYDHPPSYTYPQEGTAVQDDHCFFQHACKNNVTFHFFFLN